jgi:hypothetical protein
MDRRRYAVVLGLCLSLVASAPAIAQQRLFTFFTGSNAALAELSTAPGELGAVKAVFRAAAGLNVTALAAVAGGRYLALTTLIPATFNEQALQVFDLRTGVLVDTGARFSLGWIVASDRRSPRVFVCCHYSPAENRLRISAVTLSPMDVSVLDVALPPAPSFGRSTTVHTDAGPRLVLDLEFDGLAIVDLTMGTLARTIPRSMKAGYAVDDAGVIYLARATSNAAPLQLHAIDLETGLTKATAPFVLPVKDIGGPRYGLVLDGARRRLLITPGCDNCDPVPLPIGVVNVDTLALDVAVPQSAIADVGSIGLGEVNGVSLSAGGSGDSYIVWISRSSFDGPGNSPPAQCFHHSLTRVDAETGRVSEQVDMRGLGPALLGFGGGCITGTLIQLNAPTPPALSAAVNGQTVTLGWTDQGDATHFEVEAGSATGLRNLLVASANGTSLVAAGVPPGTYYVRVRATNDVGHSAPSNELQVVVRPITSAPPPATP